MRPFLLSLLALLIPGGCPAPEQGYVRLESEVKKTRDGYGVEGRKRTAKLLGLDGRYRRTNGNR